MKRDDSQQPTLIILVGRIGSGKDTMMQYLYKRYGFEYVSVGDMVRIEARRSGIQLTRKSMQDLYLSRTKSTQGSYWARRLISTIRKKGSNWIVVNGVRDFKELFALRQELTNIVVVAVRADIDERARRLLSRKREGDPFSVEEFQEQDRRENLLMHTKKLEKVADFTIENNGPVSIFESRIDNLIAKLREKVSSSHVRPHSGAC